MIDDATQEASVRYLLGEMPSEEVAAFARELATNDELKAFLREAEEDLASLAHAAPPRVPPPELADQIFAAAFGGKAATAAARNERENIVAFPAPRRSSIAWLPWALAACLAIGCGLLAWDRVELRRERDGLLAQNTTLQNQNQISQVAIVTLKGQLEGYAASNAVLLWDQRRQTGELQIAKLPTLKPNEDYQLWAINSGDPNPINAGLLRVSNDGKARVNFRPDKPVAPQHSFALSIGPKGGTPAPAGPVVLVTQ